MGPKEKPDLRIVRKDQIAQPHEPSGTEGWGAALENVLGNKTEVAKKLSERLSHLETTFQDFPEEGELTVEQNAYGSLTVTMHADGWAGIDAKALENLLNDCVRELPNEVAAIRSFKPMRGNLSSREDRARYFRQIREGLL